MQIKLVSDDPPGASDIRSGGWKRTSWSGSVGFDSEWGFVDAPTAASAVVWRVVICRFFPLLFKDPSAALEQHRQATSRARVKTSHKPRICSPFLHYYIPCSREQRKKVQERSLCKSHENRFIFCLLSYFSIKKPLAQKLSSVILTFIRLVPPTPRPVSSTRL